jgi:preprotein translocase subunit SecF
MCVLSFLLCAGSIGMLFVNKAVRGSHLNWTIDFKGGTEVIYKFQDKSAEPGTVKYISADPSKVRAALQKAGAEGFDVSDRSWTADNGSTVHGILVRTPRFGATTEEQKKAANDAFSTRFADREIDRLQWSGDRLFVRTRKPIEFAEAADVWPVAKLEAKDWDADTIKAYATPDQGTGEYSMTFSMHGLERQYEQVLEQEIPGVDVVVEQTSQVSAKAGNELRNDGIKSLFYAMLLIVMYLAVRFDIRYAPGAIVATFHDAIMVLGTFAVLWVDVWLSWVAGRLAGFGFSGNDTGVVVDRIRENMG